MLLDKCLVQILVEDQNGDDYLGTGYSIGNGLIITARHVVFFKERAANPKMTLVWPETENNDMSFTDKDVIYQGDESIDLAVIRCPQETIFKPPVVNFDPPYPSLLNAKWASP
jgi:hypothetical protein